MDALRMYAASRLVGGKEVVVIVAKRDIDVAEELCYDYNANRIWFSCL